MNQASTRGVKIGLAGMLAMALWVGGSTAHAAGDAGAGKTVFAEQCALCHGEKADGNGPEAKDLFWKPANLTAGSFKFRTTRSGQLPTDADLERTIKQGLPTTAMVANDHLTDKQVADVIAFIKTLSPKWKDGPGTTVDIEPPKDLEKLVAKGAAWYKKARCKQCHGEDGSGEGVSTAELTAGGRPTKPAVLTRRPFKGGDTAADIYRALATGLDGTPMPSFLDALDPEPIWAMAQYIVSLEDRKAAKLETDDEKKGREVAKKQPGRKP